MDAALRQVELHLILIGGLHPFHGKRFEFHGGTVLRFCRTIGVRSWTILDMFFVTSADTSDPRQPHAFTTMTSATSPNLARIPAGDFLMGAVDAEDDERPVHRVFVSEFFIGRFPVTRDEYGRFVRATGHPAPAIRDLPLIT